MKIKSLRISGIGRIGELSLVFNDGLNVICGENGTGKTTILNTIVDAFSGINSVLKKNASFSDGQYCLEYEVDNGIVEKITSQVTAFKPAEKTDSKDGKYARNIMFFKDDRSIDYKEQTAIPRDAQSNQWLLQRNLINGISSDDLKGWFCNRCIFGKIGEGLTEVQKENLDYAQKAFSIFDSNIAYSRIDAQTLDIMLSSNQGEIYYEYLSSGFKSCMYLILGLIKEIEIRFTDEEISASDFDGVVLIDEIDLHLHPSWQSRLLQTLRDIFPKAQFIVTTHSPNILQALGKDEIIPLTMDEEGEIGIKELSLTQYGLQGWTIEEILRDVMELPETTSKIFEETKDAYDRAMDLDNAEEAIKNYKKLKEMLHTDSVLRRLLDFQIAGIGVYDDKVNSSTKAD